MQASLCLPVDIEIVLIEGNCLDALTFKRVFRQRGVINSIIRFHDAQSGLRYLTTRPFHCGVIVLIDMHTLNKDDFVFMQTLRANARAKDILVYALTSLSSSFQIPDSGFSDVSGYIRREHFSDDFEQILQCAETKWRIVQVPQSIEGVSL